MHNARLSFLLSCPASKVSKTIVFVQHKSIYLILCIHSSSTANQNACDSQVSIVACQNERCSSNLQRKEKLKNARPTSKLYSFHRGCSDWLLLFCQSIRNCCLTRRYMKKVLFQLLQMSDPPIYILDTNKSHTLPMYWRRHLLRNFPAHLSSKRWSFFHYIKRMHVM